MKLINLLGTALLGGLLSTAVQAAPQRVGDFGLLDDQGVFHQLSRYRNKEALVLMSFAKSCANMTDLVAQYKSLQQSYEAQGVAFMLLDSLDAGRPEMAAVQAGLPILEDDGQLVSETLGISRAGEIVILDPERLTLLYRGPVHEHVASTLDGALQGSVADTMIMDAAGCELNFPVKQQHASAVPDYSTEVAPIVAEQCAICHRPGGIGPFAMDSHLMLQGWSPMIREVLLTKRMPPEQVDPYIGHFSNARYINDADMQKLVHWIDAGSPRGTGAVDPLAALSFPETDDWQLGEPDYIVKAPKHEIPATGVLDYINVDVELPFNEDKWVKAVQFVPGDRSVLHHLLTYVTAPAEDFDGGESDTRSIARRFLEGYAPGKIDAMEFPEDTGVFIPAGHKLSMQFHYTTNGRATSDETILGLYMHDEPPKYENFTRSISGRFLIPPYAIDHKAKAEYVFDEDVVVTGLRAHMHFRGKEMKFSVEQPDGSLKPLLSVPSYSYAWQPTYQLDNPEFIPAGTKVHVTGTFDNSEYNPANPDPSKQITFGLQSWDEMFIGYWTYHAATPTN
ncbi:MAG: hypothetical protein RLZZ385_2808 [Pseudomonadota bacterium]|jgi:mono/diheme cytochrome c family protein